MIQEATQTHRRIILRWLILAFAILGFAVAGYALLVMWFGWKLALAIFIIDFSIGLRLKS